MRPASMNALLLLSAVSLAPTRSHRVGRAQVEIQLEKGAAPATSAAAGETLQNRSLPVGPLGADYDKEVETLLQLVDEQHKGTIDELLKYAADQLEGKMASIAPSQRAFHGGAVDMLWPPHSYNSIAAGGSFQVMKLLEARGKLKVGRIMGSSGGGASALLALADPEGRSTTLLRLYIAFALSVGEDHIFAPAKEAWSATHLWAGLYRKALSLPGAFSRVQDSLYLADLCGDWNVWPRNTVFHNFAQPQDAVEAAYATGDASVTGFIRGTKVADYRGTCCDGGHPVPISGVGLTLHYNTWYSMSYAATITVDTIKELFMKGVDDTIKYFVSPEDPSNRITVAKCKPGTMFYDVKARKETKGTCHETGTSAI